ncbi:MAG TPA: amidohydrolase family protein [Candidatus Hydrogenedentes bacterium]|nr:amidohydrolase family protein [Candidatus Hydrogenedentota bacterium]HPG70248.1 amidohydrolase family protein [Candidatus Hydrogenedentota bacterium]
MGNPVNRRRFMGSTGSALGLGLGMAGGAGAAHGAALAEMADSLRASIQALVDETPLMDTHEHLLPEADRVANLGRENVTPAPDFGMLMSHYTDSDLQVAGMSVEDYRRLIGRGLAPKDKWRLVAPYYERCRHTGYQLCVRESVRALYAEDDLREDNCEAISQRLCEEVKPGFYRRILREVANIEHAQVNCLNSAVFRESESASDLLSYDFWTVNIASGVNRNALCQCAGTEVTTLKQAHKAIDDVFEKFGPRAIAVKDQCAYWRGLDFGEVPDNDAAPLFDRFVKDGSSLAPEEKKALQDNLFRHCLRRATEYKLPVKLHTGYIAGHNSMNLARVRDNLTGVAALVRDFPDTTFVLMHIAYPCQHELIALCKQNTQIYADMCWAWIIDPASATRFLKEFIMAAPACKLFTFGGDFIPVELAPGHARVARRGIALALTQLVCEGWLAESDVPALVERIMRGNARETYDLERVLRA